jgi:hypothetical protein
MAEGKAAKSAFEEKGAAGKDGRIHVEWSGWVGWRREVIIFSCIDSGLGLADEWGVIALRRGDWAENLDLDLDYLVEKMRRGTLNPTPFL